MERLVDAVTPLGDALWFRQMDGTEGLSSLFEFDVTFHSTKTTLNAKAMLGQPVTLKVEKDGGGVRYLNGICTRFAGGGRVGEHMTFFARLSPWLWLAGRRSDCKIFQFKTVPDIIQEVLGPYGFPLSPQLNRSYREWDYCVQYQETDLDFVMRLMEHEGIYFYFEHADGSHTLKLVDEIASNPLLPGKSSINYVGPDALTLPDEEHIGGWRVTEEVSSGEYITDDYDFKKPRFDLTTKRKSPFGHSQDAWERYMWPGGYVELGDGEAYAPVRRETLGSEHERCTGQTTVRTMATGYRFNLARCPRADQNREYLVVACTYYFRDNSRLSASSGAGPSEWNIDFIAQPTSIPFRPQLRTPKPRTMGPQTAVVVGPKGEEIYTDEYGRIKVQFHWDRYGANDENSSCWVRVAQPWAGDKWGFIHIPRIGQEVVVDFIGGDPDYPLITGSVYNADQMPPYALPANKTASGVKSHSSKGGTAKDFNEIRMEDSKDKEQLYVHAQRNLDTVVEGDESRVVGQDRNTQIRRHDQRFVHGNDKHLVQGNQDSQIEGNQSTTVKKNQDTTVQGNQNDMVAANRTQSVASNLNEQTGGSHMEVVGGDHTFSVGGDDKTMIQGDQSNLVLGDRSSVTIGSDTIASTGSLSMFGAQGMSMMTPLQLASSCMTRRAEVFATDTTTVAASQSLEVGVNQTNTIGLNQTNSVGGTRSSTVGLSDSTTVGGNSVLTTGGVASITAGAGVSLTGGTVVAVTGATVTITGTMITLTGTVMVVGPLVVAGPIVATSVISPLYSPGAGNLW